VEISGISSMATRHVLAELADAYGERSNQRVAIESVGGIDAARRVQSGEPFDFVVLAANAIDELAALGRVDGNGRIGFARSGIGVAVSAGSPRPDICTEASVREAVLCARSVGYSTGPSGAHLARLFECWGIADAIAPRLVRPPPGVPIATLIANGDVELGFQQTSELIDVPGIDVVGSLPAAIQLVTTFCAAPCTATTHAPAVRALLSFLASPQAGDAKRRHGMEPA
jgi:molybdate transport system substrate-binding protein